MLLSYEEQLKLSADLPLPNRVNSFNSTNSPEYNKWMGGTGRPDLLRRERDLRVSDFDGYIPLYIDGAAWGARSPALAVKREEKKATTTEPRRDSRPQRPAQHRCHLMCRPSHKAHTAADPFESRDARLCSYIPHNLRNRQSDP